MNIFDYPEEPHVRKHGPRGYRKYRHYKRWLRDEFSFRCVYCLCRERWYPNGQDSFSVEHFLPKAKFPYCECCYENLLYACVKCNALKRDQELDCHPSHELDCYPFTESFTMHLETRSDGFVHHKTATGEKLIDILRLNRCELVDWRTMLMVVLPVLEGSSDAADIEMLRFWRGFPIDLPELRKEKPPDGNSKLQGVQECCFCLREAGVLPEFY